MPLIRSHDGRDEFFSEDWNAHVMYFYDPAGNIGEFSARHTLTTGFDARHIQCVGEIGLATDDVHATVQSLTAQTGVVVYRDLSDTFASVGDEHGLSIVVKRRRIWFPDMGKAADVFPTIVTIRNDNGQEHTITT